MRDCLPIYPSMTGNRSRVRDRVRDRLRPCSIPQLPIIFKLTFDTISSVHLCIPQSFINTPIHPSIHPSPIQQPESIHVKNNPQPYRSPHIRKIKSKVQPSLPTMTRQVKTPLSTRWQRSIHGNRPKKITLLHVSLSHYDDDDDDDDDDDNAGRHIHHIIPTRTYAL